MNRRTFLSLVAAGTVGLMLPGKLPKQCRCGKFHPSINCSKEEFVARLMQNAIDSHDARIEDALFNGDFL